MERDAALGLHHGVGRPVLIVVDVIKGAALHWPRFQDDSFIMSTGSVKPLEDAFRVSQNDTVTWVAGLTGMHDIDSLQLLSQAALAPTGKIVDTDYTMVANFPTSLLGSAAVFDRVPTDWPKPVVRTS